MAQLVTLGAQLVCTQGAAPSVLAVPAPTVTGEVKPTANIMDFAPVVNIPPFGACTVLQGPCVPAIASPWTPGSPTVMVRGMPALNNTSTCNCTIGGVISIVAPATTKEMVA
jgi:hypothetical protein